MEIEGQMGTEECFCCYYSLKEVNTEYSLEGLLLKLWYFGHLICRAKSLEKTLMLGKIEGKRTRGWQKIRWLDSITDSVDMNLSTLGDSEGQKSLACCSPWGRKESDITYQLKNKNNSLVFLLFVFRMVKVTYLNIDRNNLIKWENSGIGERKENY